MDSKINDVGQQMAAVQDFQIKESENQVQEKRVIVNQGEITYNAVSSQGDTLSISEAGKSADAGDRVVLLGRSGAGGIALQEENEAYTIESASSSVNLNLSNYTENELKQMYLKGEITKLEYDEELKSREAME